MCSVWFRWRNVCKIDVWICMTIMHKSRAVENPLIIGKALILNRSGKINWFYQMEWSSFDHRDQYGLHLAGSVNVCSLLEAVDMRPCWNSRNVLFLRGSSIPHVWSHLRNSWVLCLWMKEKKLCSIRHWNSESADDSRGLSYSNHSNLIQRKVHRPVMERWHCLLFDKFFLGNLLCAACCGFLLLGNVLRDS